MAERREDPNDTGNAARLGFRDAADIRFVPELKTWLIWSGRVWEPDTIGQMTERAKAVAAAIYVEAGLIPDDDLRARVAGHARTSLQLPRINAMIELAQSLPELVLSVHELDKNRMLLGVMNGVVDLSKGKLVAPTREMHITRQAPVHFDRNAKCPLFLQFVGDCMGHEKTLLT